MGCPRCGSWSVKSDRSLGGRMVCGRCGTPLDGVAQRGRGPMPRLSGMSRQPWRLGLIALVVLAALFAAWNPRQPMPSQRTPASQGFL